MEAETKNKPVTLSINKSAQLLPPPQTLLTVGGILTAIILTFITLQSADGRWLSYYG
ncbi:hypothetical protein [Thalassobacillus sp. C254]|uniref:hypothetical protein n=1 Tax=Thalassobacillus sp. C254 TaxID=1225341 RepID=UPI0012EE1952|nr:hypothetical protein [Thalassobacillus sp. C254]